MNWTEIHEVIRDQIAWQKQRLLDEARQTIPNATADDILQPNDFPELENNPNFRYEEGALAGMQTLQTTLFALEKNM